MAAISAKYMASSRLFMHRRLLFGNSTTRFVLQRQPLINDMIFVAYELNLPLNMEKPHYRSQRAGEWSLIWAHGSRPIYRALTYIAVPLLGPHQPRYIGLTLYWVFSAVANFYQEMSRCQTLILLADGHFKNSDLFQQHSRVIKSSSNIINFTADTDFFTKKKTWQSEATGGWFNIKMSWQ